MKRFGWSCFLMLVISLWCSPASATAFKITEMAVTTKIVRGNPIDSVHRISSSSVKHLFCFTRISSAEPLDTAIKHVWYKDGAKVAEYDLPVKGKRWRTYSKKTIEKGTSAGDWRIEALDDQGTVVKAVEFRMN